MKRKVAVLTFLGFFILTSILPVVVSADYRDGFDTYLNTTVNPFLWKTTTTNSTCISAFQVSSVAANILTLPNVYAYTINPGPSGGVCVGGTAAANSSIRFQASQPVSTIKAYFRIASNFTDLSASTLKAFICFTTTRATPCNIASPSMSAFLNNCTPISSGYCALSQSFPTLPGSNYFFEFELFFAATWAQNNTGTGVCRPTCTVNWDNTTITGGNIVVPGANFFLVNTSNTQLFSISSYAGSRIILNRTNSVNDSAQWAPNGVQVPDINYSGLVGSVLITTFVGGIYQRSLIPSSNTTMYLDMPNLVVAYTISIIGPPNVYGPHSKIFISQSGKVYTSGYLDSTARFSTALIPGNYIVEVTSQTGSMTQIQTLNFPSTAAAVSFNAYANITASNPAGVASAINWQAGWNSSSAPTGIIVNYVDSLASTCGTAPVGIEVKRINGSGAFNVFSQNFTISGCHGNTSELFSITIPAALNNPNMNWTLSNQLFVYLNATNFFGTPDVLGSQGLACFNCLLGGTSLNLPSSTLGLAILPGITWLDLIAYGVMILTAGAFGIYWSRFGFFVVAAEAAFFTFAGWFIMPGSTTVASTIVTVFIVIAFIGLMIYHERT